MRSRRGLGVVIVLAGIAAIIILGVFGIPPMNIPSVTQTRTGIDIQGGIAVTLEPSDGYVPSVEQLETAKTVIERRLDSQNVYDRNITIDTVSKRILVEIPYKSKANDSELLQADYNAQKTVVDYIGKTAELTFRPYNTNIVTSDGTPVMSEEVLVRGERVTDAKAAFHESKYIVVLKFDSEGAGQFAEATQRFIGQQIAIYMDTELLIAPVVNSVIPGGEATIEGQYTLEQASMLASQIRSGSMPFKLEPSELTQITPLLGENALIVTIQAGIIAFFLVFIFMVLIYRLPGFIAMVSLIGLLAATLSIMAIAQITLTLPGIAGIILSIGMSIDANIIISERIREELEEGKTLRASIDAGYKNAFAAILDSNITTLISAVVLYMLGSGPIKGFAVTLGLGVLLSFISVILVSRILTRAAADFKFSKNHKLYGIQGDAR